MAKKVMKTKKKLVKKPVKKTIRKPVVKVAKKSAKAIQQKPLKIDYSKAVTPLGQRLVVRLLQEEQVTAGGIIIPSSVKTQTGYLKAAVLAIGTGLKTKKGHLKPLDVQVGDTILFQGYASVKVEFKSTLGTEELHILNESDVLGIV